MQVIKVDDSLAVLLPKTLVDELGLKEGDDVSVLSIAKDTMTTQRAATRAEFLKQIEQLRFPLPDGYKFDRDEANER
ncbi:AbrB/MazE/SpoVT family DNA-binding domain-containing protein [Bradyrhizobium sp. HKCCYLS3077]|uniref:AbrB/MazE/SpoVT family DNA-binding domain-containing protein n=1 Tax=Bradyrhizobium sp. HKCCYLS3077 TaxID=3420761 RepID=UPI003EBE43B8